jgi:xanthine dehydrogenase accessory factor
VGGGALEHAVLRRAHATLGDPAASGPQTVTIALGPELGMCCGGSVTVLLEALAAPWMIGIVGAGHVASALVPLLVQLGFAVTVVDEREEYAEAARLPGARVRCGTYRELGAAVPRTGAVLVMTHDHALDQDALEWALGERYAFVGGVGSRAKRERTLARLAAKDFPADVSPRLRMPLGMSIGARLPDELAVSIAGEMIAWRRGAERA